MITELRLQNFKSWQDTGPMRFAPLTGFFGANSSGKSAILQFLLMLKQTVESADRNTVLAFNGPYTQLGTFRDVMFQHKVPGEICYSLSWQPENTMLTTTANDKMYTIAEGLSFEADIIGDDDSIRLKDFTYYISETDGNENAFGITTRGEAYDLVGDFRLKQEHSQRIWATGSPVKSYGFPEASSYIYENKEIIGDLPWLFEGCFKDTFYLGPLRDYPHRTYVWGGEQPQDVGVHGENFVAALLASRVGKMGVEERVASWLQELGLVHSFRLQPIAKGRQEYEVLVKRTKDATEVPVTDVGFGVSQILPVLTLCYYAPAGATIILEQPEIHLHPSVQAGLADMLIDVTNDERDIQIILESHSEHLLRRLQRRIAEEKFAAEDAALYFCEMGEQGASHLKPLLLNEYGYITNWPEDFFGDEMEDLVEQSKAAVSREQEKREAKPEIIVAQEVAA